MAENKKELYKVILSPIYKFNDNYCLTYLTDNNYNSILDALSK